MSAWVAITSSWVNSLPTPDFYNNNNSNVTTKLYFMVTKNISSNLLKPTDDSGLSVKQCIFFQPCP